MIEFIVISLFVILLLAYYTMGRNFSRPTLLYVGGFLACAIVAYFYKTEWGVHIMSPDTALIIIGGAFAFYLVELIEYKKHSSILENVEVTSDVFVSIKPIKLIVFLI